METSFYRHQQGDAPNARRNFTPLLLLFYTTHSDESKVTPSRKKKPETGLHHITSTAGAGAKVTAKAGSVESPCTNRFCVSASMAKQFPCDSHGVIVNLSRARSPPVPPSPVNFLFSSKVKTFQHHTTR